MEIDEGLMSLDLDLVLEITAGRNVPLPWSACRSRLRVEPLDGGRTTRLTMTCLAPAPGGEERRLAEGVLRSVLVLSLQSLRRRIEASSPSLSSSPC
jgi:hypothetical protein